MSAIAPFPRAPVDLRDRASYVRYLSSQHAVEPKDDLLVALAHGRKVLDLGCVDHGAEGALQLGDAWLHGRLKRVASQLVGVDRLAEDARQLNARGFDIRIGDVEALALGEQFDLVIAGDLVEHLSNIGRFFEAVSRHMHAGSAFVLTTPNPFNVEQFAHALLDNQILVNPEHTVWIDPRVMHELISRTPFSIIDFRWVDTRFAMPVRKRFVHRFINPLSELAMRARPVLRRDYAVMLALR